MSQKTSFYCLLLENKHIAQTLLCILDTRLTVNTLNLHRNEQFPFICCFLLNLCISKLRLYHLPIANYTHASCVSSQRLPDVSGVSDVENEHRTGRAFKKTYTPQKTLVYSLI